MSRKEEVRGMKRERIEASRLFVDMDGTLAKFQTVETLEMLYEKGYFLNLEPLHNVLAAIRKIVQEHPEKQVYIMSSVLSDSSYALQEKNEWLDRYLPEIDMEHRIFPPCGKNKLDYVPEGIRPTDCLLDDYTVNLNAWEPPAKGIKIMNGINGTKGTWQADRLSIGRSGEDLAEKIVSIMEGREHFRDMGPDQKAIGQEILRNEDLKKEAFSEETAVMTETEHSGPMTADVIMLANQKHDQKVRTGYISKEQRSQLEFLTEKQALEAIKEGIHICSVTDYQEYHGIHADEYFIQEIKKESTIKNLYATFGTGIVHKAFVSPYYDSPKELVQLLTESVREREAEENRKGEENMDNTIENNKKEQEAPFEVWLGNLTAYTEGDLVGDWVSLPQEETRLKEIIQEISRNGQDELIIMDTSFREDCTYLKENIGEWSNIEELNLIAQLIGEEQHPGVQAYMEVYNNLTPLEIANLYMQEEKIPFYPYQFEGSDDQELMERLTEEEKLGYTILEMDPETRQLLERVQIGNTNAMAYINVEEIGRDLSISDYSVNEHGYYDMNDAEPDLKAYTRDEIKEHLAEQRNQDIEKDMDRSKEISGHPKNQKYRNTPAAPSL